MINKQHMIRKEIYSIEQIFSLMKSDPEFFYLDGDKINARSQRYKLFYTKGIDCRCGLHGKFFAKEKHPGTVSNRYHLNLYAINDSGHEVLMTKDHINPKANGGQNIMSNYETMCSPCNRKKGHQTNV